MSWCLDWLLDQTSYTGWNKRADIYIRNYLMSRKISHPANEVDALKNILNRAGLGFLNKNDIEFHLAEIHSDILQQKILTGSVTASATQLSSNSVKNKKRSKNYLPLIAALSVIIILGLLFMSGKESAQKNDPVEIIKLNQQEFETVDRLIQVGAGLASLNRRPVIINNHVNVNALIIPDNKDKLKSWLDLGTEQLTDAWGHPLKYAGMTRGAFKGRVVLRSAGADGQFKTDDDLLLNGYPYLDSLTVRKDNKIISRLSERIKSIASEPTDQDASDKTSDFDAVAEAVDMELTEELLSEEDNLTDETDSAQEEARIEEEPLIGVEVKP